MPPMPQVPQAPYIERDITNVEIRLALKVFTQLMTTQSQVITNNVATQANLRVGPQPNICLMCFYVLLCVS